MDDHFLPRQRAEWVTFGINGLLKLGMTSVPTAIAPELQRAAMDELGMRVVVSKGKSKTRRTVRRVSPRYR